MRGSRRSFLKGAGMIVLLAVGACVTEAHAKITRSEPKDGAKLQASPKTIELWFNELLDEEFNTIEVFSSKDLTEKTRKNLATGKPLVDPKDRTHLTLKVPPLAPGSYVVEYRVLSRDGHTAPGRFTFTVQPKS